MKANKYIKRANMQFRVFAEQIKAYGNQPTVRYSAIIRGFLDHQKNLKDELYTGTSIQDITNHMRKFDRFIDAVYVKSELESMPLVEVVAIDSYYSGDLLINMDKWSLVDMDWYEQRHRDRRKLKFLVEQANQEEE